jgi:hypothetical protein
MHLNNCSVILTNLLARILPTETGTHVSVISEIGVRISATAPVTPTDPGPLELEPMPGARLEVLKRLDRRMVQSRRRGLPTEQVQAEGEHG